MQLRSRLVVGGACASAVCAGACAGPIQVGAAGAAHEASRAPSAAVPVPASNVSRRVERRALQLLADTRGLGPRPMAIVGDLTGDGVQELALGFPGTRGDPTRVGRVRLVDGASGAELAQSEMRAPFVDFGAAMALVGDLDGDGRRDLAVAAPVWGTGYAARGVVRLLSTERLLTLHELSISDPFDHGFGAALDYDPSSNRLIVGVPGGWSSHTCSDHGGVDVFDLDTFERVLRVRFAAEHCYCEERHAAFGAYLDGPYGFGRGVRVCEDVDGDGTSDFLVVGVDELNGSRAYALSGADASVLRTFDDER